MIIAMVGGKGGVGKSTLSVCLGAEWHQRGKRVLLVDLDPQGSVMTWAEVAAEAGNETPDAVALGDNVRKALPGLARDYDVVVLDCPGRMAKRVAGALMVVDMAVMPCSGSTTDVWAVSETVEIVEQASELRPSLVAAIVLNRIQSTTNMGRTAREALSEVSPVVLRTTIGQRIAFAEALAAGQGVTTWAGGSLAALELRRLADELEGLVEGSEAFDAAR